MSDDRLQATIAASPTWTADLPTAALGGALDLTDWGLIAAEGPEAAQFLHGQLTQDVMLLGTQEARMAGYCSPKGRLLATFILWKTSPDQVLLACSADVLPATLKRLSMFVLRAKVKLSDASAQWRLVGLAGPQAAEALGADAPSTAWARASMGAASVLRLPDAAGAPRWLWAAPRDAEQPPALPPLPEARWHWLEVMSAVPRITAPTVDQFVPQMVNLEAVGGVNFKKGCYPGQEVVARSQYRGTLKRRGFLLAAPVEARAGQEVFHSEDPSQPCGMVVLAAPDARAEGRWSLFAELKIAATGSGSLHLGAADGPTLALEPLPYELPPQD